MNALLAAALLLVVSVRTASVAVAQPAVQLAVTGSRLRPPLLAAALAAQMRAMATQPTAQLTAAQELWSWTLGGAAMAAARTKVAVAWPASSLRTATQMWLQPAVAAAAMATQAAAVAAVAVVVEVAVAAA